METQKTPNSQNTPEKEEHMGGIMLSDFRLYYKTTVTKQCGLGKKQTYRSMEQNREPRNKPTSLQLINL